MAAIGKEAGNQFRVDFGALASGGLRRMISGEAVQVDPFLIGRAITHIMQRCSLRSAGGQRMLWNEYRVILARADFDPLRALQEHLVRDLISVLSQEALRLGGSLVGDLCVHLVVDELHELPAGEAVIRVGFAPNESLAAPAAGEMTVRVDVLRPPAGVTSGEVDGSGATVRVDEVAPGTAGEWRPYLVRWIGGEAVAPPGVRSILGRPHQSAPERFIALRQAGARINKQHLWILPSAWTVVVGRFPSANPVHVNGAPLPPASEVEVSGPTVEITLSRGELVLTLTRV